MNQVIHKHRLSEERQETIPHSAIDAYLAQEEDGVYLNLEVQNLIDIASTHYKNLAEDLSNCVVNLRFKPKNGSFLKMPGMTCLGSFFDFAQNPFAKIKIENPDLVDHLKMDFSITRKTDLFKMMFVENLRVKGFSKRETSSGNMSFLQGRIDENLTLLYKVSVPVYDNPTVTFSHSEHMSGKNMMQDPIFMATVVNDVFNKLTFALLDFDAQNKSLSARSNWMKMWWEMLKQASPQECTDYEMALEDNLEGSHDTESKMDLIETLVGKYRNYINSDNMIYSNWVKMQDDN